MNELVVETDVDDVEQVVVTAAALELVDELELDVVELDATDVLLVEGGVELEVVDVVLVVEAGFELRAR